MEDKLLKIINNYGVLNQVRQFNEECYELTEAIFDYEYTGIANNEKLIEHIAEEIADVMVMLSQFKEYYHIDGNKILKIMNEKIDRQLERMRWEDEGN